MKRLETWCLREAYSIQEKNITFSHFVGKDFTNLFQNSN